MRWWSLIDKISPTRLARKTSSFLSIQFVKRNHFRKIALEDKKRVRILQDSYQNCTKLSLLHPFCHFYDKVINRALSCVSHSSVWLKACLSFFQSRDPVLWILVCEKTWIICPDICPSASTCVQEQPSSFFCMHTMGPFVQKRGS